jgi:tetratricopeptide (TPR) repeat protein
VSGFRDLVSHCFHRHSELLAFCVLLLISLIAYSNSLSNSFHFDDIVGVVRNPTIRDLRNIPSYFTDPSTFALGRTREWRPVLQITYALNYYMAGLNPLIFRVSNFLFHLGTAFLIFLIVTEIGEQSPQKLRPDPRVSAALPALFAAALFAVHTANTEAVDYIWARSSVLATFFYLLAFYCFLRGPFSGGNMKHLPWHLAGLLSFALGVGTKATAVTLPAALVLYEFLFLNPASKNPIRLFLEEPQRFKKYVPMTAVFLTYIAVRTILLPRMFTGVAAGGGRSSLSYLLTQFRAWVYYLKLFLWPDPLIVDFSGFGWSYSLWDIRVLLSLGLVIVILVGAWLTRKTQPLISFFAWWYFIALLPEASFIPLADAVVGYRAYLAYVGLAVVSTMMTLQASLWIWRRLHGPEETAGSRFWLAYGSLTGVVLVVLTVATIVRNRDWRDETTLWSDVMKKDPTNPRAYMMLGAQFLNQEEYEKAQQMFNNAIRLAPEVSHVYVLRGHLNSRLDRNDQALSDFTTAIKLDPRDPYGHFYRGELFRKTGESDKAVNDYQAALKFQPYYTDAFLGLAMAYLDKENTGKAAETCKKLVEIDPNDRRGYDCLGTLLLEQNRAAEAIQLYETAVKLMPLDSELLYSLGVAYEKSEMYKEAGSAFERAGRLISRPDRREPKPRPSIN